MVEQYAPRKSEEIMQIVKHALFDEKPLHICGHNSKSFLSNAPSKDKTLSVCTMQHFNNIVSYEAEELILIAEPGVLLDDIEALLKKNNQMLAFDVPRYSHFFEDSLKETLGGIMIGSYGGSRRVTAGGPRDYLLGYKAVSGRGEDYQAGARVMKNVTGYDLPKLMAGSFGQFSILYEMILKTWPKPETEQTILIENDTLSEALSLMSKIFGSRYECSCASYIPKDCAHFFGLENSSILCRFEGTEASIRYRIDATRKHIVKDFEICDEEISQDLWEKCKNVAPFNAKNRKKGSVWRIVLTASKAQDFIDFCHENTIEGQYYADWGGGLIWYNEWYPTQENAHKIRSFLDKNTMGHAICMVRDDEDIACFHPKKQAHQVLERKVKKSFDPKFLFNPYRMV